VAFFSGFIKPLPHHITYFPGGKDALVSQGPFQPIRDAQNLPDAGVLADPLGERANVVVVAHGVETR